MNKVLKRDEFVQLMEQKEYDELETVNEGLLKTLFGVAKNLFKKDWETVDDHGNTELVKIYKEMDDKLTGFSLMKLSKKEECNQIRQALVDFACDWYELKMNHAKESESEPKPAKSMKFKNETLKSNLDSLERKIRDIASGDEQMNKWANRLKEDMINVINRSILNEIENPEVKKAVEDKISEDSKKSEELNKKMLKWENDQLVGINKERDTLISSFNATPEAGEISGDKEISKLCKPFLNSTKEDLLKYAEGDNVLGLKKIFASSNGKKELSLSDRSYNILDAFYNKLNKDMKLFKDAQTPGQSVQAMCIAVNAFVKTCGMKNPTFDKNTVELMARCAIKSDGAVSYKLPLTKDGNYFTDVVYSISQGTFKTKDNQDLKLPENFKKNASTLLNDIPKRAEQLVKDFADKRDKDLKNLK